jgi:hypothetical protein
LLTRRVFLRKRLRSLGIFSISRREYLRICRVIQSVLSPPAPPAVYFSFAMAVRPSLTSPLLLVGVLFLAAVCAQWASNVANVTHVGPRSEYKSPLELPFQSVTQVDYRRVWSGMRGGHVRSIALGRKYRRKLSNRKQFQSGGAHDVGMFLWTQLCMSGFPPHPGPESDATTNYTGTQAPLLKVTVAVGGAAATRGVSLYQVFALTNPTTTDYAKAKLNFKRLRQKCPGFLVEWLDRKCAFEGAGVQHAAPALFSLTELNRFITFLHENVFVTTNKRIQFVTNVKQFFVEHRHQLGQIWQTETELKPTFSCVDPREGDPLAVDPSTVTPLINESQATLDTKVVRTSYSAILNVSAAMGIEIKPSSNQGRGVYTTTVPLGQISELVHMLGIYACSKFVCNSSTPKDSKYTHIRYLCFRHGLSRRSCNGATPSSTTTGGTPPRMTSNATSALLPCSPCLRCINDSHHLRGLMWWTPLERVSKAF